MYIHKMYLEKLQIQSGTVIANMYDAQTVTHCNIYNKNQYIFYLIEHLIYNYKLQPGVLKYIKILK